uniref:Uncharacterized protein n=1 Tax=Anguilla anguilla TaxID=7936 RepID=A0A0E9RUZ1_ANGAN
MAPVGCPTDRATRLAPYLRVTCNEGHSSWLSGAGLYNSHS